MYFCNNINFKTIFFSSIFSDLSPEQQKRLLEIRKKKHELLLEIQVSFHFICN